MLTLLALALGPTSAQAQQKEPTITRTIVYRQISDFRSGVSPNSIARMKMSADGSKIVLAADNKKVFTINADGTGLVRVFDYLEYRPGCPCVDPYVDISADGATIIWTDSIGEIFIADSDGSNRRRLATELPRQGGGTDGPLIPLRPRLTADGRYVYFMHAGSGPDVAGAYYVSAEGGPPVQLFSYRQMSQQLFGLSGNEYNGNIAFRSDLAISADGSRMVFGSYNFRAEGNTITFDGEQLHRLREFSLGNSGGDEGNIVISEDGGKLAVRRDSGHLLTMDFDGANEVSLGTSGARMMAMTPDGAQVLTSSDAPIPMSLRNTDGSGRLDLVTLTSYGFFNPFFRAGIWATVSMSPDGQRFCFKTELPGAPR